MRADHYTEEVTDLVDSTAYIDMHFPLKVA